MTDETSNHRNSHRLLSSVSGRSIGWSQMVANFAGACIVTSYFVFFDQVSSAQLVQNTFYVVGIVFVGLVIITLVIVKIKDGS